MYCKNGTVVFQFQQGVNLADTTECDHKVVKAQSVAILIQGPF